MKYLDEQPAPECNLTPEELQELIAKMEMKKYGHTISYDEIKDNPLPQMTYSVKEHKMVKRTNVLNN